MERWRDIPGYEKLYQVSNLGNIRCIKRGKVIDGNKIPKAKTMIEEGKTQEFVAKFLGCSRSNVRNIKSGKCWVNSAIIHPIKTHANKDGALFFCIRKNGVLKNLLVRRVVWIAFKGPILDNHIIKHKDGNKQNCRLKNLRLSKRKSY